MSSGGVLGFKKKDRLCAECELRVQPKSAVLVCDLEAAIEETKKLCKKKYAINSFMEANIDEYFKQFVKRLGVCVEAVR